MTRRFRWAVRASGLVVLVLLGCSGGQNASSVTVNPRLAFVDELPGDKNVTVGSGQLTFPADGNDWLLQRQAGDGLLCTFACPSPFLRELVSVASTGDTYIVQTQSGKLTDVWSDAHIAPTYLVPAGDDLPARRRLSGGARVSAQGKTSGVVVSVTNPFSYGPYKYPSSPSAGDLTFSASASGSYTVKFPFAGEWNLSSGAIWFAVGVEGTLDGTFIGQAQLPFGTYSQTVTDVTPNPALGLGVFLIPFDPPVIVFPFVQLETVTSLKVSGAFSTGVVQAPFHASYSNGVRYDFPQAVSPWKSTTVPDTFTMSVALDPTFDTTVETKGSLGFGFGFKFLFNLEEPAGAGPTITALNDISLAVDSYVDCSKVPNAGLTAALTSDLEFTGGVDVSIFGYDIDGASLPLGKIPLGTLWTYPYPSGLAALPLGVPTTCQCTIDGVAYGPDTVDAANACQSCQPNVNLKAWTPVADGTACTDGTCRQGACIAATVPPPPPPPPPTTTGSYCPTASYARTPCCDINNGHAEQCNTSISPACMGDYGPCCARRIPNAANQDCDPGQFCIRYQAGYDTAGFCSADQTLIYGLPCATNADCGPGFACPHAGDTVCSMATPCTCVPSDTAGACSIDPVTNESNCPYPTACISITGEYCTRSSALCWCQ